MAVSSVDGGLFLSKIRTLRSLTLGITSLVVIWFTTTITNPLLMCLFLMKQDSEAYFTTYNLGLKTNDTNFTSQVWL